MEALMGNTNLLLAGLMIACSAMPVTGFADDKVAEAPFVPECDTPPGNGEVLASRGLLAEGGHAIQIANGVRGNAIIKVRDSRSGSLVLSFYVAGSQEATIQGIPDGDYTVQYATGKALDLFCKQFVSLDGAEEFPGVQSFRTERTSTQIITSVLSYTLYEVSNGNVEPQTISAEAFNRP
jgi:hypothetical protein